MTETNNIDVRMSKLETLWNVTVAWEGGEGARDLAPNTFLSEHEARRIADNLNAHERKHPQSTMRLFGVHRVR